MTAITLETLRADFEAVIDAFGCHMTYPEPDEFYADLRRCHPKGSTNEALHANGLLVTGIYIVARDHGLEAAMLYKLSDGAIDPRVQP